jgi:hypothetical protein
MVTFVEIHDIYHEKMMGVIGGLLFQVSGFRLVVNLQLETCNLNLFNEK